MRALNYFFSEAAESLWRTRRAAGLSMITIAAGLFVLGFFLLINANLQRVIGRWTDSAEVSVYLRDDANGEQLKAVNDLLTKSGLTSSIQFFSKEEAQRAPVGLHLADREPCEIAPPDDQASFAGDVLAQQEPQQRRLARPARTGQEDELSLVDAQGQIAHRVDAAAVHLGDVLRFDHESR